MNALPILIVELPVPMGLEKEWNTWYHEVHIPDVLRTVDGAVSSRRFRLLDGEDEYIYLVVHEFENDEKLQRYYSSTAVDSRWVDYGALWELPSSFRRRAFTPIWDRDEPVQQHDR